MYKDRILNEKDLLINFETHVDNRGCLTFVENNEKLPFLVQRVFWIYDIPASVLRGAHAHRTCAEIIIPVHGSFMVDIVKNKDEKITFTMDKPNRGLYVPAMTWCELKAFSPDAVCLCFASELYHPDGYIHDFQTFLSECEC